MFLSDNSGDPVIDVYNDLADNTKLNDRILRYVTSDTLEIQFE